MTRVDQKPHWYLRVTEYCPVCGRWREHRERKYGKRPTEITRRYVTKPIYDYCNEGLVR